MRLIRRGGGSVSPREGRNNADSMGLNEKELGEPVL